MILLNITFAVNSDISGDFIDFIRDTYIPLAESSGLYASLLTEVRTEPQTDALTGTPTRTLALQMRAPSQSVADEFEADVLPRILTLIGSTWGQAVAMFCTTLDVLHDPSRK